MPLAAPPTAPAPVIKTAGAPQTSQMPKAPKKPKGPPTKPDHMKGVVDLESQVAERMNGVLSGAVKRYDDTTVAQMKQGLFETSRGQATQSKRNLRSELAKSGTLRSGAYGRGVSDIDRSAASDYTKGVREIMMEKAKAEWEDKTKALDQAQQWLKQKYDYDIGLKQIDATLESARIQAGATLGAAALSAGATRDAARASAGAARAGAQMSYDLGMSRIAEEARQFDITRMQG